MKIKFTEFYQGVKTYPLAFQVGETVEVDDEVGAELIEMGKAKEVASKTASKRTAKKEGAGDEA